MPFQAADVAELCSALLSALKIRGRLWLVVDRLDGDPVADAPGVDTCETLPLDDPIFVEQPERSPLLLALDASQQAHWELLDWSLQAALNEVTRAPYRPTVCGWISADASPPVLQKALRRKLRTRLEGRGAAYLRYFDPRVLPRVAQIIGPAAFEEFLSPVRLWLQLNRDGQLHTFEGPKTARPSMLTLLQPDAAQSAALLRVEDVSKVVARLARLGQRIAHAQDPRIDAWLVHAAQLGLTEADDRVAYAVHAMHQGEAFTAHCQLAQWCRTAAQAGVPLDDLIDAELIDLIPGTTPP